jgi:L-asparagine transporter-like permease
VDGRGVPVRGISASAAAMFGGVILNYFVPGKVLEYIIISSAVLLMGTWTSIIVSHLGFRARTRGAVHRFPMPLYPWASWIVLAFIAGIALIMATMLQMYLPIGFVAAFYVFVMVLYLLTAKSRVLAGQD